MLPDSPILEFGNHRIVIPHISAFTYQSSGTWHLVYVHFNGQMLNIRVDTIEEAIEHVTAIENIIESYYYSIAGFDINIPIDPVAEPGLEI